MDIRNIDVKMYRTGEIAGERNEGVRHIKTLPFMSVVQALEGSYDVSLGAESGGKGAGAGKSINTGESGAFIAPSAVTQTLTHHVNRESGLMSAQWVFFDVTVNGAARLDSLYDFPVLMSEEYLWQTRKIIGNLCASRGLCLDLSELYRLIDILLKISSPKKQPDKLTTDIIAYISENYGKKISYEDFASALNISQSSLFRKFRSEFGKTPSEYINEFRILHASAILEKEDVPVAKLAAMVGFDDGFYFSKLFKKVTGTSPSFYRKKMFE